MKSVLVTGGAGFIGANFVHYLLKVEPGVRIINLDALTYAGSLENLKDLPDPSRHTFVHGDICDVELVDRLMREHEIDTVVHFAAETHVDRSILGPTPFIQTNIVGTFTLLEAARQAWGAERSEKRFHHVSSDEVFGSLSPTDPAFREVTPYDPRSPYSAAKASSDHLARAYFHTYELPVTVTNCSNNYGPYQFPEKLIPLFVTNALEDKPLPLYGEGKNVRDWLFVEDNCEAIDVVLHEGKVGEIYNIGADNEQMNITITKKILSAFFSRNRSRMISSVRFRQYLTRKPCEGCLYLRKACLMYCENLIKITPPWFLYLHTICYIGPRNLPNISCR